MSCKAQVTKLEHRYWFQDSNFFIIAIENLEGMYGLVSLTLKTRIDWRHIILTRYDSEQYL